MFAITSAKGLCHNLETWNFDFCGDFKLMEQDAPSALDVFHFGGITDLYNKLKSWNFDMGSFPIVKADYSRVLSAIKKFINKDS